MMRFWLSWRPRLLLASGAAAVETSKDLGNDGFWSTWSDATFERAATKRNS